MNKKVNTNKTILHRSLPFVHPYHSTIEDLEIFYQTLIDLQNKFPKDVRSYMNYVDEKYPTMDVDEKNMAIGLGMIEDELATSASKIYKLIDDVRSLLVYYPGGDAIGINKK